MSYGGQALGSVFMSDSHSAIIVAPGRQNLFRFVGRFQVKELK